GARRRPSRTRSARRGWPPPRARGSTAAPRSPQPADRLRASRQGNQMNLSCARRRAGAFFSTPLAGRDQGQVSSPRRACRSPTPACSSCVSSAATAGEICFWPLREPILARTVISRCRAARSAACARGSFPASQSVAERSTSSWARPIRLPMPPARSPKSEVTLATRLSRAAIRQRTASIVMAGSHPGGSVVVLVVGTVVEEVVLDDEVAVVVGVVVVDVVDGAVWVVVLLVLVV